MALKINHISQATIPSPDSVSSAQDYTVTHRLAHEPSNLTFECRLAQTKGAAVVPPGFGRTAKLVHLIRQSCPGTRIICTSDPIASPTRIEKDDCGVGSCGYDLGAGCLRGSAADHLRFQLPLVAGNLCPSLKHNYHQTTFIKAFLKM